MRKRIVLILGLCLIFALSLTNCGKDELTRSKAEKIIGRQLQLPKCITQDFNKSMTLYIYYDNTRAAQCFEDLQINQGLISGKPLKKYRDYYIAQIDLTEKANEYISNKSKDDNVVKVKMCDIKKIEVTGIKLQNNGKEALVEYQYNYENITPFGQYYDIFMKHQGSIYNFSFTEIRNYSPREKIKDAAYCALYDDGWRVME